MGEGGTLRTALWRLAMRLARATGVETWYPSSTFIMGLRRARPVVFASTEMLRDLLESLLEVSASEHLHLGGYLTPRWSGPVWTEHVDALAHMNPTKRSRVVIEGRKEDLGRGPIDWQVQIALGSRDDEGTWIHSASASDPVTRAVLKRVAELVDEHTASPGRRASVVLEPISLEEVRKRVFESDEYRKNRRVAWVTGLLGGAIGGLVTAALAAIIGAGR